LSHRQHICPFDITADEAAAQGLHTACPNVQSLCTAPRNLCSPCPGLQVGPLGGLRSALCHLCARSAPAAGTAAAAPAAAAAVHRFWPAAVAQDAAGHHRTKEPTARTRRVLGQRVPDAQLCGRYVERAAPAWIRFYGSMHGMDNGTHWQHVRARCPCNKPARQFKRPCHLLSWLTSSCFHPKHSGAVHRAMRSITSV
jgi:hypothetical protein